VTNTKLHLCPDVQELVGQLIPRAAVVVGACRFPMAVRASFSRVTRALASQLGQRTSLPRCRQFGVWASPTARDGVKPDSSAASGSASSSSSARSHPYRSEADRRDSRIFGDRDHKALIDEIIRVDHAGEYGAVRIYQGQKDVLQGDKSVAELITVRRFDVTCSATHRWCVWRKRASLIPLVSQEMQATEVEHLETLDVMMAERRARPTALLPLWHVAGYALGELLSVRSFCWRS